MLKNSKDVFVSIFLTFKIGEKYSVFLLNTAANKSTLSTIIDSTSKIEPSFETTPIAEFLYLGF